MLSDTKSRLNRLEANVDALTKEVDGIKTLLKYFNSSIDRLVEMNIEISNSRLLVDNPLEKLKQVEHKLQGEINSCVRIINNLAAKVNENDRS